MTNAANSMMENQNYAFFDAHRQELAQRFPDMYLIIKNRQVLSAVPTLAEAITLAGQQGLEEGSYLMQFCDKAGRGMVCTYRSRAHFAK